MATNNAATTGNQATSNFTAASDVLFRGTTTLTPEANASAASLSPEQRTAVKGLVAAVPDAAANPLAYLRWKNQLASVAGGEGPESDYARALIASNPDFGKQVLAQDDALRGRSGKLGEFGANKDIEQLKAEDPAAAEELSRIYKSGVGTETPLTSGFRVAAEQGGASLTRAPGVVEQAVGGLGDTYDQLAPENNPFLHGLDEIGTKFATGEAGKELGGTAATAAAQNIGEAGKPGFNRAGLALTQGGDIVAQGQQDLGIVRATAQGEGPSAAAILGNQMIDNTQRAMNSQAATARGGNLAAAQRQALLGGAQMALQGQQQIAAQRAQEQLDAQKILTEGNAALGTTASQIAGQGTALGTAQVDRATAMAKGLGNVYDSNSANAVAGMNALSNAGSVYAGSAGQQVGAQQRGKEAVLNFTSNLLGNTGTQAVTSKGQDQNYDLGVKELEFKKKQNEQDQIWKGVGAISSAAGDAASFGVK